MLQAAAAPLNFPNAIRMTAVLGWPLVVGPKVCARLTALVVWADERRHGGGEPSTALHRKA